MVRAIALGDVHGATASTKLEPQTLPNHQSLRTPCNHCRHKSKDACTGDTKRIPTRIRGIAPGARLQSRVRTLFLTDQSLSTGGPFARPFAPSAKRRCTPERCLASVETWEKVTLKDPSLRLERLSDAADCDDADAPCCRTHNAAGGMMP